MAALGRPPLNLQPLGLLDHFAIKNGGEYPQDLIPTLQPTMEMGDWYSQVNGQDFDLARATVAGAAVGAGSMAFTSSNPAGLPLSGGGLIAVPDTEVWLITEYSVRWAWDAVAGGTLNGVALAVLNSSSALMRGVASTQIGVLTSSATLIQGGMTALATGPMWLKPGEIPIFHHGGIIPGAATLTFAGHLRFRRLRI